MLNKSTSRSEYVVQSIETPYPIGFAFQYNGDGTPQIRVAIGDMVAKENEHFVISEDSLSIKLLSLGENDKWVGSALVIERDIPFVQESDYQVGRISSEQIEKDFDLSVMRDQMLAGQIKEHADEVRGEIDALHSRIDYVQEEHASDMAAADEVMATKATKSDVDEALATKADKADVEAELTEVKTTLATKATKTELENANTVLSEGIQGNAGAILKTREDFASADQAIRDDMNQSDSELQTQITAQAAEIATKQDKLTAGDNVIINGNVISATSGGAGLSFIVYDTLPETGESGVVYLVPKDGEAPDVYDEYVWITTTQTFELIGSTKVDLTGYATKDELSNYLPLAGGTMAGDIFMSANGQLNTYNIKFANPDYPNNFNYYYSLGKDAAGTDSGLGIRVNKGSKHARYFFTLTSFCALPNPSGAKLDLGNTAKPWKTIYVAAMNNGADLIVPTEGGTLARLEDLANIDVLPDQTGNEGKVLVTDGASASWQEPAGGTKVIFKEWE